MQIGLGQPAPPDKFGKPQRPGRVIGRQPYQPVAPTFFPDVLWVGTGERVLGARRGDAQRLEGPSDGLVTDLLGVMPSAKLISAASCSVQTLVGLPKVRGLWCKSARSCARRRASKIDWTVRGRED
jgi:hypothetical protein